MTNPQQEVCGFEFVSKLEIPDIGVTSLLYRHKVHGCPFIYLQTEDSHNCFACTFRTAPNNDYGCSHMLEHLVLDGTKKYPVKDLFSELSKRSFSTYMNAMTANQWTSFPFSTINKQDYFNILDCYLDSCFHPQLSPIDFMSECFHVEFEDGDPSKPLINSGVVYNEMRGSFNSVARRVYTEIAKNIFPNSPEHFDSGGIPEYIAQSTIDDIRKHHAKYYHPSNAFFYHYGNIPIEEVFSKVNEVISPFPVSDWKFSTSIFDQPRWTEPKRIEIEDDFDSMNKDKTRQHRVIVSYLVGDWSDPIAHNDIDFLTDLFQHGDSSPIYKNIIKPGYAVKTFLSGFRDDTFNTYVSFGFEGIAEADVEKVIGLIQETIEQCIKEGFDKQRIDALIHENELLAQVLTSNMGMLCLNRIITTTGYGIDPQQMLNSDFYLSNIRAHLKSNPNFYQELAKKCFIENQHKLTVVVKPVEGYLDRLNEKIKVGLAEKKSKLTQSEIDQIVKNYKLLKEESQKEQPIELLPSIKKSDIELECKYTHLTKTENNVSVLAIPLNKMTYINIYLKVDFTTDLFQYIRLLTDVLNSVGAGDMDEEQFDVFKSLHCDGVKISLGTKTNYDDQDDGYFRVSISTMCLDRNIDITTKILNMILFEPRLINPAQVKVLTKRKLNALNSRYQSRGDSLLDTIIPGGLTNMAAAQTLVNGPYYLKFLNELIEKDNWDEVCQKLETAYKLLLSKSRARAFVHTTSIDSQVIPQVTEIISKINEGKDMNAKGEVPVSKEIYKDNKKIFIDTNSSTNFTMISCRTVPYNDDTNVLYSVFDELITNEFLNQLIRNQLGAYGVWAVASVNKGFFDINSYRDPNPQACLKAFKKALNDCASGKITDEMVDRAIVKVFAAFDRPEAPSQKAELEFEGKSKEIIQKRRNIVFNTTKEQLTKIAKILNESEWNYGIYSSSASHQPPEGFKVMKIDE